MKTFCYVMILFCCLGCRARDEWTLTSPDGAIRFVVKQVAESEGNTVLRYSVYSGDSLVIHSSRLGLVMDGKEYGRNARATGKEIIKSIYEPYELKSGKQLNTIDDCREMILPFEGFRLIVRAYNDGVAFRYAFTQDDDGRQHTITDELTEFSVPADGKAWIHPYDWNERRKPSYEQYSKNGIGIRTDAPHGRGWAFPMLFHTSDHWIMITEACLDGSYPATHVDNSGDGKAYKIRFPEIEEPIVPDAVEPVSVFPWYTPWRAIIVGKGLNTIFRTQMVSHLNPPSVVGDDSWILPGRASWSWWYAGGSPRDYKEQIKYVDFSHSMGWEYVLIDAGWQQMTNGGTMEDVVRYAGEKGVGIWLWYHSGAGREHDSIPAHRLMSDPVLRRAEMERISRLGVRGIKVDFFDTDKQRVIRLYPDLLRDAAEFYLLVDLHGATLPRGFERTYPNMLTTEAIRGAETLGRQERCDRAAEHNATVPFTRNVVGSMDYTPVTFSNKIRQGIPAIRRTTVAHQLALAVVFESGFQCYADRAEAYEELPRLPKQFLREVPAAWDESRLLAGYPSDYVVVARRKGKVWYIGGINGKNEARELEFTLPDTCKELISTWMTDGEDQDSFGYEVVSVVDGKVKVKLLANGGFAGIIR